jgi:hypothetical protein
VEHVDEQGHRSRRTISTLFSGSSESLTIVEETFIATSFLVPKSLTIAEEMFVAPVRRGMMVAEPALCGRWISTGSGGGALCRVRLRGCWGAGAGEDS